MPAANTLVQAIIFHLDYSNSLLNRLPAFTLVPYLIHLPQSSENDLFKMHFCSCDLSLLKTFKDFLLFVG